MHAGPRGSVGAPRKVGCKGREGDARIAGLASADERGVAVHGKAL